MPIFNAEMTMQAVFQRFPDNNQHISSEEEKMLLTTTQSIEVLRHCRW